MNATFVLVRSHSPIFFFVSFTPPPPNRSVLRVCSGVQAALRQGAPSRPVGREAPSPFYLLSDVQMSGETSATLIFKTMRGEIVQIHLRERKKSRVSHLRQVRRKTRVGVLRKQETELQQQASPLASAFSRHIVTHIPLPQTTGVTTARTITTTTISPPPSLPTPSQIRLSALFDSALILTTDVGKIKTGTQMAINKPSWHSKTCKV